jgi:hydrogenase nickel incorporation protein HypA/HybF
MHELSIAMQILDLVRPSLPAGGTIQSVQVTAGLLSGICSDSLSFCFTEMAGQEGHPGAELKIHRPPALYRCHSCKKEYYVDQVETPCPACSSLERTMLSGAEFTVDFVEIEQGDSHV